MTRTELVARLKDYATGDEYQRVIEQAADMLEADELMRLANIDCVNHFNAIKEDYDKLKEAARLALDAVEWAQSMIDTGGQSCPEAELSIDKAYKALKKALK
jgi:hypothetical protein